MHTEKDADMAIDQRRIQMYQANTTQSYEIMDGMKVKTFLPLPVEVQADPEITSLLGELSPENNWGDRKKAAQKLGYMRKPEALPGLLDALPQDPFWMVRCAIIQALEFINDQAAIPTLKAVAQDDGFQVVRSHAARAVERLS